MKDQFTARDILATASERLTGHGYSAVDRSLLPEWTPSNFRLFEDTYGVVALASYEAWSELSESWQEAQAWLAELITSNLNRGEPKAWDGYLVLLTPAQIPWEAVREATSIRYDTSRVRKLLLTGDLLESIADIEGALLPLLPLTQDIVLPRWESVWDALPSMLSRSVPEEAVRVLIDAFQQQQPLIEGLHSYVVDHENI